MSKKDSKNKIKVGFVGVNGRMCRSVIDKILAERQGRDDADIDIVAGVEKENSILIGKKFKEIPNLLDFVELSELTVLGNIADVKCEVDIWIDFSYPVATLFHLKELRDKKVGYMIGTTGFDEKQIETIRSYSDVRPIILAENFSVGINVLMYLLEQILSIPVTNPFDIEISEFHHRDKLDAPSGTAKMLLEKVVELKKIAKQDIIYDRSKSGPPKAGQVGVTARRGGGVIGEHEVGFYGKNEYISLKHVAITRDAFAYGVIVSIYHLNQLLQQGRNGMYGIRDVLSL